MIFSTNRGEQLAILGPERGRRGAARDPCWNPHEMGVQAIVFRVDLYDYCNNLLFNQVQPPCYN